MSTYEFRCLLITDAPVREHLSPNEVVLALARALFEEPAEIRVDGLTLVRIT